MSDSEQNYDGEDEVSSEEVVENSTTNISSIFKGVQDYFSLKVNNIYI